MIRLAVCLLMLYSVNACLADAEIDPTKLVDSQVHLVGQYMPKNGNVDFRVKVHVKGTGKPMVIVLCSYMETQWNISIDNDADVRLILISGWFEQSAINIPDGVPVKTIVGSGRDSDQANYFWAHSKYSAEGHRVQEKIKTLLGKEIDTFQGQYEGREFVIDGVKNQPDPQLASSKATPKEESKITLWNSKVTREVGGNADRVTVEKVIRKLFDLETNEKQQRLKQAEVDLKKLNEKFEKRLAASEEIIQSRIESYMKDYQTTSDSIEGSTSDIESPNEIAARAWEMLTEQKPVEARKLLEKAVKLDPKNAEAWNKLGWVVLNIGDVAGALKAFDESLNLNPNNFGALNGRGRVYLALGKLEESEKDLLQGTEAVIDMTGEENAVQNQMTASWFGLVEVNIKQKDWPTAIEWAERYLKHAPEDPMMKNLLKQAKVGK